MHIMHIMLFLKQIYTSANIKDRNELGCENKHDTNGWMNFSVINVSVESFLLYPNELLT